MITSRRISLFVLLAAVMATGSAARGADAPPRSPYVPAGYKFEWSDEFDAPELNEAEWNYRLGGRPVIHHKKENVRVENGMVRIDLLKGPNRGPRGIKKIKPFSGGGIISKRGFTEGYFEVRAKLPQSRGWHPAWWSYASYEEGTLPGSSWNPHDLQKPLLEIDMFERASGLPLNKLKFGMVLHMENKRKPIYKLLPTLPFSPSDDFHVYGLELSQDFVVFYLDGKIMNMADARDLPYHVQHMWLTCTATSPPEQTDAMFYDYLRYYSIDAEGYKKRKTEIFDLLRKRDERAKTARQQYASNGLDIWIEPAHFPHTGEWDVRTRLDPQHPGVEVKFLRGQTDRNIDLSDRERSAQAAVVVPRAGTYRLWVRANDHLKEPGSRYFHVRVNGKQSETTFGTHGKDGFYWQDGGVYELDEGTAGIVIYDTSKWFARVDQLLLTTDLDYQPKSIGGVENATYR